MKRIKPPVRFRTRYRRKRFIGIISVVLVISTILIFNSIYNAPLKIFERDIEKMASKYYEEYYYKRISEQNPESEIGNILQLKTENGMQPVLLRQLILFNGGENLKFREKITQKGYKCDEELTDAVITPLKPFGKKDYKIEVNLSCLKK